MSGDVLSVGSLFSGIGGLELGLEMTGRFKTEWQVEQNEYCRRVLARHWPNAQRFEDVRNVGKENLPAVDVICGGFPCQDVSTSGKRAGIKEGTRSGLWFEYARIVRELRPQYVIVENVPGLLSDGMGTVLGDISLLGYDAEWTTLSACSVGAPHPRERVFIIAHSERRDVEELGTRPRPYRNPGPKASNGPLYVGDFGMGWPIESRVLRSRHGFPAGSLTLHALGNAVVPQVAEVVARRLLEIHDSLNTEAA